MTLKQAARELGLSRVRMLQLVHAKKLIAKKDPVGWWRISRRELKRFARSRNAPV